MERKYIFVTGGVVSSLGKGIIASSLGLLLKKRNFRVTIQKLDPYLNIDPGTMNPYQHGEVYVTADGAETDLDLGHYERFIDSNLAKINNVTAGQIYSDVLSKERQGNYLGRTVQMVPHVSDLIKERIFQAAKETNAEITIVEVGGTVGDIESLIFLESIRQIRKNVESINVAYLHVTLIPGLKVINELKTKPTQHSVEMLRSKGIRPDILVCRAEKALSLSLKEKLALFTDVDLNSIIESPDVKHIYEIPLSLEKQGLIQRILQRLALEQRTPELKAWQEFVHRIKNPQDKVKVGIIGKYTKLEDSYISITEALKHAGAHLQTEVEVEFILSDKLSDSAQLAKQVKELSSLIIPGGFGDRGIEGKISAIKAARENKIPFLGICLGMQCAVIEFARNVVGITQATSSEFDESSSHAIIDLLPGQERSTLKGGTMRLGNYSCQVQKETQAYSLYQKEVFSERHRHRYEFAKSNYFDLLKEKGLLISGLSPDGQLAEIIELSKEKHPFFIGVQFHPEYKSRPQSPHPLFLGFLRASLEQSRAVQKLKNF